MKKLKIKITVFPRQARMAEAKRFTNVPRWHRISCRMGEAGSKPGRSSLMSRGEMAEKADD